MATYTAAAGGGNWSDDATWGGSGHPVAGDVALLDATSGAVTVDVDSACTTLDLTGYTSTLALGTYALTVSGNVTIGTTVGSLATLTIGISGGTGLTVGGDLLVALRGVITCSGASKISCAGSWDVSAGTFTKSTGTVTFNATASGKTVKSGSNTYYNVTWNGSGGEWTLQDNFTQTRAVAFTAGTIILNLKMYTASYLQTVTLGNGFSLTVGAGLCYLYGVNITIPTGASVTVSTGTFYPFALTVSGTGTLAASGAATILCGGSVNISSSNFSAGTSTLYSYQLGGAVTLSSAEPLYNYHVCHPNGDANVTVTLLSSLVVINNFTILASAGKTRSFSAGSNTLTIGGNFANGDTFNAGTGTVILNDATKVTTVTGSTTFNILSITTPDKVVRFTAGTTQTVASFVATGTAGHLVTLNNVTGASTWAISDASGVNSVSYSSIAHSAAAGGASWQAYLSNGNVNGGTNSGWDFSGFPALLLGGD